MWKQLDSCVMTFLWFVWLYLYLLIKWKNKEGKNSGNFLTLCTPSCSHWWPPCLSRWASGPPDTSGKENRNMGWCQKPNVSMESTNGNRSRSNWLIKVWAPVQSCPRQCKTSGPTQWDHSRESISESCSIHCPIGAYQSKYLFTKLIVELRKF